MGRGDEPGAAHRYMELEQALNDLTADIKETDGSI
jgi:hypothetical protein